MRIHSPIVIVALLFVAVAVVPPAVGAAEGGAGGNCSFPYEATDATGTAVTVEERPDRIVVLAPSAAQTVWALGASERVVGMPRNYYATYLNGTDGIQDVVTDRGQPIQERVVALDPDLVLAPNVIGNESVTALRDAGLTVYRFEEAGSLAAVSAKTRRTGRLIGSCAAAERVSSDTEARVSEIRSATADRDHPLVYYAMGGGYTAGPETFVGDVIATAGAENLATRANISRYGKISPEIVVSEDPDWIVAPRGVSIAGTGVENTTAYRQDRIVRVNRNYLHQAGPRVVRPLERIARHLHPSAVGAAKPTATQTTDAVGALDTTSPTPTATGGPAVGPAAGALAFVAGAGLLGRRR
ncbi:MAG: PGF-CTERM-anchored ABC transporter substrate-binding protein [Halococcoides sp.]